MKITTAANQYKIQDTACSAPQLVILLLDAAIRYVREAAGHMRDSNWVEKGKAVEAAQSCIAELRNNLNRTESNEIVQNLDRTYDFLNTKITYGNLKKDAVQFDQVADALLSLRDAWTTLFDRLKAQGALAESPA